MRTTEVEFHWNDTSTLPSEIATVCIVDGLEEYERVSKDYGFDELIFFYFLSEEEFQRAFLNTGEFEFRIIRDLDAPNTNIGG